MAVSSASIRVEGLYSVEKEYLLRLLGIEGDTMPEPAFVRSGIKRAFLTGLFDEIRIEEDKGVIKIRVKEREIIEGIKVKGNFYVSGKDIVQAFLLKEGAPLRYDLLQEAKAQLREYLSKRGFPEAEIEIRVEKRGSRPRIILYIKEGSPLLINEIEGPEEVFPFIRLSEGEPFDLFLLERDISSIRDFFKEEGYIKPDVRASFEKGILRFNISPGMRLIVNFRGNRHFSEKELLRLMPFIDAEAFTEELIEEAQARLVYAYKKEGYLFPQVIFERTGSENEQRLIFMISEGSRYRIRKLHFYGNTLSTEKLLEIGGIKEGPYYIPDKFNAAIERIRGLYHSLGYINVSIDEPVIDRDEQSKTLSITVNIKEGERVLLDKLTIKGNKEFEESLLKELIGLKEGMAFNETDINDARLRLIEFYSSRGYSDVECDLQIEVQDSSASVVFNIVEGKKYLFGDTIIRGNLHTSYRVINREIPYKKGERFRQESLLEFSQNLYRLGLFSEVEMEPIREDSTQNVLIKVREAPAGTFEFGIGYGEYERYRGFFDLTYRNLFGMNHQVSLRTEVSSLERRFIFNYLNPRLFDTKTSFRITPLYEERKEKNIDTGEILYRLRRYSGRMGIETPLSKSLKFEFYHEFSLVKTFGVRPEVILPREDTGTLTISSFIPGMIYDTRDNPFDPRKGLLTGGRLKIASRGVGSELEFLKVTADASTYLSLSERLVLAMGIKGGAVWPYGKTVEIPVVERFFLGGRTSVRGYSQDSLGPKVNGTPVGGDYFVQTNLELRWYLLKSFSLVTFLDGGNVWPGNEAFSTAQLRYSTGIGLRYNTPAGPIRLDYGHKLERLPGESKGELHFSIGHAF